MTWPLCPQEGACHMGFVRSVGKIEHWLDSASSQWRWGGDADYREIVARWRNRCEPLLVCRSQRVRGERAMLAVDQRLPDDVAVFSLPGYQYLPSSTSPTAPPYVYFVRQLLSVDREVVNCHDAIVVDMAFSYTCLYTHEQPIRRDTALTIRSGEAERAKGA
jgi:hypothetical protein